MEYESEGDNKCNSDTNCCWCTWNDPLMISIGTWRFRYKRTSSDYPNNSIIKIGQNTEKSSGDLRKFTVLQTPERNNQLTLEWKILQRVMIIIEIVNLPSQRTTKWKSKKTKIFGPKNLLKMRATLFLIISDALRTVTKDSLGASGGVMVSKLD